jgi:hypothetical protein
MASLRNEVEEAIVSDMAQTGEFIESWQTWWKGGTYSLEPTQENMEMAVRWISALHQQVLRLASEIDALRPAIGPG